MIHAPLVGLDDRQALHDHRQHLNTLTRLSSERLADGDAFAAFIFSDRRCRVGAPVAHDLLLRSEALRRLGFPDSAKADLAAAAALDPSDPLVNRRLIEAADDRSEPAARWAIADPRSGQSLIEAAVSFLFDRGARVVGSVTVDGDRLTGWFVNREPRALTVRVELQNGRCELQLPPRGGALEGGRPAFTRIALTVPAAFSHLSILADDRPNEGAVVTVRVNPAPLPPDRIVGRDHASLGEPGAAGARLVSVVIPIYDDVDVTRRCLDALAAQTREDLTLRVILVDDAAPEPAMKSLLAEACARHGFDLIVNAGNLGFIGAVNQALARVTSGDVVLLNADVVLPPDAIAKLAAAVASRPGIGIVNPLTNNGQFTSFPSPLQDNAFEDEARIALLDRTAAATVPAVLVETPGGIGYCFYITRACLDAVGGMPEVYLRGYYEDIEFCLRAAGRGFATVCAPGIYVGHKGSASFKGEKKRLVERNRRAIEGRFPRYRADLEAFYRADPLRPARAAIEARAMPFGPAEVVLAGHVTYAPVLEARAAALGATGYSAAILTWKVANGVAGARFRRPGQDELRQRTYLIATPEEREALEDDLMALDPRRIEVAGAPGLFGAVLDAALQHGVEFGVLLSESLGHAPPLDHGCLSLDEAEPCATCVENFNVNWQPHGIGGDLHRTWQRGAISPALFVAMDAMAEEVATDLSSDAFPASRFERAALVAGGARPRGASRPMLALPYPEPDRMTERFLSVLATTLLRQNAGWHLVLLGAGLDDRRLMSAGNLLVTGPVRHVDYADAVVHYGAACLFAPRRWAGYGALARLADDLDLPKAYFDWSIGALPAGERDLSIDPRVCDAKAAQAVAAWLGWHAIGSET